MSVRARLEAGPFDPSAELANLILMTGLPLRSRAGVQLALVCPAGQTACCRSQSMACAL